jgi:FtsP/CotA-like multicopper oxidase with cupredoxin domain
MNPQIDRRSFLLASAAAGCAPGFPSLSPRAVAAAPATQLTIDRRTIEVNGRAASVFGIYQANGTPGITLGPADPFRVELINRTAEETIIHWHGQRPPYAQDGVADRNVPLIRAGAAQRYDYRSTPGTHWMHSHHSLQEQALMAAPLVVRSKDEAKADLQEVTVLLHDFSFRDPEEILAELTGKAATGGQGAEHDKSGMAGMDHSGTAGMDHSGTSMDKKQAAEAPMAMDLNDVEYDAFLANDRTLGDPWIVKVERLGRMRLRLINGATSSAFWIDLGELTGTILAVDGNPVHPITGRRFPMTMAQRLDILLELPSDGAFPITAQVEGKRHRTGFVLATPDARIAKIPDQAESAAPPVDLTLETRLRAANPLAIRTADVVLSMRLTGSMAPYVWSINDREWPNVDRPIIRQGQRVVIDITNPTMMAHPMHLHGHHFQVTSVDGSDLAGAVGDTVLVPATGSVRIAFDANNPGRWPFHCHNLYHMVTGMMTELVYDTFA